MMMLRKELFTLATLAILATLSTPVNSDSNIYNAVLGLPLKMFAGRSSDAEPFGRTTSCAKSCPGSSTFSYQNNMVHVFDYHSSAKVFGGIQEPQFAVSARVHITVAGPCEMILALSHVVLQGTYSPISEFAAALTSTPLRFAFHDGLVSNICPSTEEPIWVLNFKRAVLSNFQSTMGDIGSSTVVTVQENDVSGACTSEYRSTEAETGVFNITRTRTSNCVSRPVPPSNCKISALLQLMPVFNNEQTCYQKISAGILKGSMCREFIRYPEFMDTPEELPIVAVVTELSMAYQFKADFVVIPNYNATRASLVHDWEPRDTSLPNEWMEVVKEIMEKFENISPSPSIFYGLTEILKNLDYVQIQNLFINAAPQLWNTAAMSFMSIGTEPAMKILVDFMNHGVVGGSQLSEIVEYMAKRFEINSSMLDLLKEVIDNETSDGVALTKVKNYCEADGACKDNSQFQSIQKSVDRDIKLKCKNPDKEADPSDNSYEIRYANININNLNILRDFGFWNPIYSLAIDQCIQSNISEVRYAALETVRKSPCSQHDYGSLLMVWQNPKLDDYSQILVYKALARCPTEMLSSVVMHKLLLENVTQVTSYIWSHLSNLDDQPWTAEILADARLSNKFTKEDLRFSRHFKREVILSNKTFLVEFEAIFCRYSMKPQYASLKVSTKDFYPNNIFEMETREKNETRGQFYSEYADINKSGSKIVTYCSTEARMFGYVVYNKEYRKDQKMFSLWTMDDIYTNVIRFGYKIIAEVSIEYLYQFLSRISSVNYQKVLDIQLKYPTSMGVPINLKLNMTTGSHEGTLLLSYAKNIDAELSLDATHAQIGCKLKASCEFLPKIKASTDSGKLQLHFNLPEEKSSLFTVDYGVYTFGSFETEQLSPKFYPNETEFSSLCIPSLKEFTGFTFCFDYYPRVRYWPIYTFKYGVSYERDPNVNGIDLTYHSSGRDNLIEVCLETAGSPSSTWSISKYELAQFVNINMTTPFFKLNGSGTYREDVLFFKESGQAVNISGTFQYRGQKAPFILINSNEVDSSTNEKKIEVNFVSSLLSTKLASSYKSGDDLTFNLNIPYQFKDDITQRFIVAFASRYFNVTSDTRYNYKTEKPTEFVRKVYSASVGLSKYKNPLITVECLGENGDHVHTHHTNVKLSGKKSTWYTTVSYVGTNDTCNLNCTSTYKSPTSVITWDKQTRYGNETSWTKSSLVLNNDTLYAMEANYANITGDVIQSNGSFSVPNHEDDAKYPVVDVKYDQKFNFTGQYFYAYLTKAYYDRSMKFNVSMRRSPNTTTTRNQPASINYSGDLAFICSQYHPFRVSVTTDYMAVAQTNRDDLTLNMNVILPFERWNKDALDVKLTSKDKYLKTIVTDKRFKTSSAYNLEGIADYDLVTNMIDYGNEKFGKPAM